MNKKMSFVKVRVKSAEESEKERRFGGVSD